MSKDLQLDLLPLAETKRPSVAKLFEIFWSSYPNKKARADAEKAFAKAIKQADIEALLKGITNYVANKPEWQAYKYPGPWLRSQCWLDEWEPQQASVKRFPTTAARHQTREEYLAAELRRAERSFS